MYDCTSILLCRYYYFRFVAILFSIIDFFVFAVLSYIRMQCLIIYYVTRLRLHNNNYITFTKYSILRCVAFFK